MGSSVSPDAWRPGDERLGPGLGMRLPSSAVRVQPIRRSGALRAASGRCAQRRRMGGVLKRVVARCRGEVSRLRFRADAGFVEQLEAERVVTLRSLRLLQQARRRRTMDQGGQGRDQTEAAVAPLLRRRRRSPPTSRARLQPRQFPARAGDAGTDQGRVIDDAEEETDQDRREGRRPRALCRIPDGRRRSP